MSLDEDGIKEDLSTSTPLTRTTPSVHQERQTLVPEPASAEPQVFNEYCTDLYLHAPVGYLSLSHDGQVQTLNFMAAEFLGQSRQSLLNSSIFDAIDPASLRALKEHLNEVFNSPGTHRCKIAVVLDRDTTAHLRLQSMVKECPISRTLHCRSVLFDITEQHQLLQEKEELREQLRRAHRMEALGRLASGIAHDFNNLLTLIIGYSKLAINQLPEEDLLSRHAHQIHKAGCQASELIEQLLDFSRHEPSSTRQVELQEFVAESQVMIDRLIGDDIALHLNLDSNPGVVIADPAQLQQVMMTLAAYAREAMPEGGQLYLRTRNMLLDADEAAPLRLSAGAYILLQVEDTSSGIAPELIPLLSDPFFFTPSSSSRALGFDLSTLFDIIEQQGGQIHVDSLPERGTIFSIYLPQHAPAEHPTTIPSVLVVDDQPDLRDYASHVLSQMNVQILRAGSAQDALLAARAQGSPIALIVTDVIMPDLSGPEIVKEIRRWHPDAQALYISGYDHQTLCFERNIDPQAPFLEKPFTPECLLKMAEELIRSADE